MAIPAMVIGLPSGAVHSNTSGGFVAAPGLVAMVPGIITPEVKGVWNALVAG